MDLWIRSQDKENLIKVSGVRVIENQIQIKAGNAGVLIVGGYKTKERALEILDEIQDFMNVQINVKGVSTELADLYIKLGILESTQKIYVMPKE